MNKGIKTLTHNHIRNILKEDQKIKLIMQLQNITNKSCGLFINPERFHT